MSGAGSSWSHDVHILEAESKGCQWSAAHPPFHTVQDLSLGNGAVIVRMSLPTSVN